MRTASWIVGVVAFLLWGGHALGDTVHLYDGRKIEGKVVSQENDAIVLIETPGGRLQFRAAEVAKIEYGAATPATPVPPVTEKPDPVATPDPSAGPGEMADGIHLNPAERELINKTAAEAENVTTAAEAVAIWQRFLARYSEGPIAQAAQKRLAIWQSRAEKNLARFGPGWLPANEVTSRSNKAGELLAKATQTEALDEALRLLDEALSAHPYRADIHFVKGRRLVKAGRRMEAFPSFEQAANLAPTHTAAWNNMGVLSALQNNWLRSFTHLTRALGSSLDNDVLYDNFDQVYTLARQAGCQKATLDSAERQMLQFIDQLHKTGKRATQIRWGNTWIEQAQMVDLRAYNDKIDEKVAANRTKLAQLDKMRLTAEAAANSLRAELARQSPTVVVVGGTRRHPIFDTVPNPTYREIQDRLAAVDGQIRNIRAEIAKLAKETDDVLTQRRNAPHANKLVMLDADGRTELASIPVGLDPAAKPAGP